MSDIPERPEAEPSEPPETATPGEQAGGGSETPEEAAPHWSAPHPVQLHRYPTVEAVAEAAAKRFLETAKRAIEKLDHFNVILGGDEIHLALYRRLAEEPYRSEVPWSRVFFVFSDERCVSPEDEESRFRRVTEALFDPLEIHEHRFLRMKGEETPADAARRYEVRLGDLFLIRPKRTFDLALLGVGADGSTAALHPGTEAAEQTEKWVAATHLPQSDEWRLTLTLPALMAARRILFLASGEGPARAVAEAFGGVAHDAPHPCERVAPPGVRREALVDFEAASRIPDKTHA